MSKTNLLINSVMGLAFVSLIMLLPIHAVAGGLTQQKTITKTITGFSPPKLDYQKLCIVNDAVDAPVNVSDSKLSIEDKLRVGVRLLNGGPNLFPDPTRAIRLLRDVMNSNSSKAPRAKFQIARLYMQGKFLPENQEKALELVEEVAPSDPYEAGYVLARLLQHLGEYGKAEKYYKRSALAGNPQAYISRAYMYRDGLIPNVDQKQIDQMIKLAESKILEELVQGDCNSMYGIGKLFLRDSLNSDNHPMGINWLEDGAVAQSAPAISYLGYLYLYGIQVKQNEQRGLDYYLQGTRLNDAESFYRLGSYWLLKKKDSVENWLKGSGYLESAAKQGHQAAIKRLIQYYRGYYGGDTQYDKAASLMKKALIIPDIAAEVPYMLAEAYIVGDGVEKNEVKAFKLFDKAAKMNYRDAMLRLGDAYKYGIGVKRSPIKSYRFYRQAASIGSRDSMIALVENYKCGVGKPPNKRYYNVWKQRAIHEGTGKILYPEVVRLAQSKKAEDKQAAFLLLKRRAGQNDREAQVMLSHFYRNAIGTKKNDKLADTWLKEAVVVGEGQDKGFSAMGEAHMDETMFGVKPQKAAEYFERAIAIGSKDAGYELGKLYDEGAKGFAKDIDKAAAAYGEAVRRGNDNAMRKLADIYKRQGKVQEGVQLLERSAAMHNMDAILELVNHYMALPKDNPDDFKQALFWHKKARDHYPCTPHTRAKLDRLTNKINSRDSTGIAQNPAEVLQSAKEGDVRSMRKMAQTYIFGSAGIEPNPEVGFKWYLAAAKSGDAISMLEIGNAYSTGLGVAISREKAGEWWAKSAEAGNAKAKQMLAVDPTLVQSAPKKKAH